MSGFSKTSFWFNGTVVALLACLPASAQDVSQSQQAPAQKFIPGVRYTTGSVTTAGWEKSLTDSNPNLKRWNWSSITSYTQSCYNKVPAGAQAARPAGHIYTKPIQISPETYAKKRTQPGVIVLGNNHGSADLSGRVHLAKQIAQEPAAKSYNVNYAVSGKVKSKHTAESLASKQVYGRLSKTQ